MLLHAIMFAFVAADSTVEPSWPLLISKISILKKVASRNDLKPLLQLDKNAGTSKYIHPPNNYPIKLVEKSKYG